MRRLFVLWVLFAAFLGAVAGTTAPQKDLDFELYDLGDTLYDTAKIRTTPGVQYLIVDFFAIHCEPCKKAVPDLVSFYRAYRSKGVELIIVVLPTEDDREGELRKIESFFKKNPVPFALAYDKYKLIGKRYGVVEPNGSAQVPQTFLLDRNGALVMRTEGHAPVLDFLKKNLR